MQTNPGLRGRRRHRKIDAYPRRVPYANANFEIPVGSIRCTRDRAGISIVIVTVVNGIGSQLNSKYNWVNH